MSLTRTFFPDTLDVFPTTVDSLLNRAFDRDLFTFGAPNTLVDVYRPRVDVWDAGDSIVCHVELPGVSKDKVHAEITNGNLCIEGETSDIQDLSKWTARMRERRFGKFSRVIALPSSIDQGKVVAEFKDGVLEMKIHKRKEAAPKKITIA